MMDYLNDEQRSAVECCARAGHNWGSDPDERCLCCAWPRAGVSVAAGGYRDESGRLRDVWPLPDVLLRLADAADVLLDDFDYDGHGHEEVRQLAHAARAHAGAIRAGGTDKP